MTKWKEIDTHNDKNRKIKTKGKKIDNCMVKIEKENITLNDKMKVNKGEMKKDRHLKWLNEKRSTPKMLKITGKKLK
jgi:hypothetical protein